MDIVATAKADATATSKRLDKLEQAEAKVAREIESQRDEVSSIRVGLVDRRDRIQTARSTKFALLRSSRDRRHELEDDVGSCRPSRRRSRRGSPATPARSPPARSSPAPAA